jgi:hypothetical protein
MKRYSRMMKAIFRISSASSTSTFTRAPRRHRLPPGRAGLRRCLTPRGTRVRGRVR